MKSLNDIIKLAHETLVENQHTLVARFVLENPSAKAKDIEICQQSTSNGIAFYVRLKSQAEVSSADVVFDEKQSYLDFKQWADTRTDGPCFAREFIHGQRLEFEKNRAALSAMKSENEFLKTLIAQSNARTENEIEELRAEMAKDKEYYNDAYANAYSDCERHTITERDKLRAENAILREGLEFYADVDNWENPCVINDPDLKAQKALAAVDKVRSE